MVAGMGLSFGAQTSAAVEACRCADSVRSLLVRTGDEVEANAMGLPEGALAMLVTGWELFGDAVARIPSDLVAYADTLVEVDRSSLATEQQITDAFAGVLGGGESR